MYQTVCSSLVVDDYVLKDTPVYLAQKKYLKLIYPNNKLQKKGSFLQKVKMREFQYQLTLNIAVGKSILGHNRCIYLCTCNADNCLTLI